MSTNGKPCERNTGLLKSDIEIGCIGACCSLMPEPRDSEEFQRVSANF